MIVIMNSTVLLLTGTAEKIVGILLYHLIIIIIEVHSSSVHSIGQNSISAESDC